jgi:alkylation response protein AidB-like acyl-CoA dehydrogenase
MLRPESEAETGFRRDVRDWFERELPSDLRDLTFRPPPALALQWYRRLSGRGWIAPHWPRASGGMGASPVEQVILFEESARIGAPELPTQGLNQIGPILQRSATPEQQARHLPPILAGDVIWCQGYSERGAGSDLAALTTRGVRDGDRLVINGHKIWTTWGQHADWMYALVRTDPEASKRGGLSLVLIDLSSAGVSRRPILTLANDYEFAEIFLDEVEVPLANVVGDLGRGWELATALLDQERLLLGSPAQPLRALERVRRLARLRAVGSALREKAMACELAVEVVTSAYLEALELAENGLPFDAAGLKILATETTQSILDVAQDLGGEASALAMPERVGQETIDFSELFLQARRLSIYGGSNEIQRGLVAARTLGLARGRG